MHLVKVLFLLTSSGLTSHLTQRCRMNYNVYVAVSFDAIVLQDKYREEPVQLLYCMSMLRSC